MKALAEQTLKATEEIATQIQGIQGATQDAVVAIPAIGTTVAEINEIASSIASAVEDRGAATRDIAGNIQRAANGTEQVSSNIAGVTRASGDVGIAASGVLGSTSKLCQQSELLQQEVAKFLATARAA